MRWRRRRHTEIPAGGLDSFLDIVANLVGILVILIMVIGVQAQDASVGDTEETDQQDTAKIIRERQRASDENGRLAVSVYEVKHKADQVAALWNRKRRERHQLQVLMTAARLDLDERRQELDQTQQDQVAISAEQRELSSKLDTINNQRSLLENEAQRPIELEHLPTPLAKTVFGSEEHFRLKGGRLIYVPLNELTDRLRDEARRKVHRLKDVPEITETIGPVQGFHLQYTMHRRTIQTGTPAGPVVRQIAELKKFVLLPMSEDVGEPVARALQAGSQFRQLIDSMRPGATVITVWTYPDSYGDFRQLKKWLFDQGFATAARPLPEGQPISGSPAGSRSAAQ